MADNASPETAAFDRRLADVDEAIRNRRNEAAAQSDSVADSADLSAAAACLERLEQLWPRGGENTETATGGESTLGDFQLIREIGRGGMGVVYEAVQLSLSRRVALKVLPFASVLDDRQIQRFKNESLAAAQLDHPHIVHVYGTGCERGVHYYAMQFIEGHTLADVIREMRTEDQPDTETPAGNADTAKIDRKAETVDVALLTTDHAPNSRENFRRIAEIGMQVADALEYAHSVGVVHRDVKPSNLLLDRSGKVYVADFGLAQIESGAELTMTGDVIGTLRYMSPEQASGDKAAIDRRSDVYSLGVTLYELLTLKPPFSGSDRAALLRQVVQDEPPPPTRLNAAIPRDLETIVLKAISKEPQMRYASASDLVEDLSRFLSCQPILAKRAGLVERATNLIRRRKRLVGVMLAGLLSASIAVGWIWRTNVTKREERERMQLTRISSAWKDAAERYGGAQQARDDLGKWAAAVAAAEYAESLFDGEIDAPRLQHNLHETVRLATAGQNAAIAHRRQAERDEWMVKQIERIRLSESNTISGRFEFSKTASRLRTAFRRYGIDIRKDSPESAAQAIRQSAISNELAAAMGLWQFRLQHNESDRKKLRAIQVVLKPKWTTTNLPPESELLKYPISSVLAAKVLRHHGRIEDAVRLLENAQRRHPADFWVNTELAFHLRRLPKPRLKEAIRFYTAAVACRPLSSAAWANLADVLGAAGNAGQAVEAAAEAIRLDPKNSHASLGMGHWLLRLGRPRQALAAFRKCIELQPTLAAAHYNLGVALFDLKRYAEATTAYREAIRLNPTAYEFHNNLGLALAEMQEYEDAVTSYRKAIELNQKRPRAHLGLAVALRKLRMDDEAIASFRTALSLSPDAETYHALSGTLRDAGRLSEVVQCYRDAVNALPGDPTMRVCLGKALERVGKRREAIAAFEQALAIRADIPGVNRKLGELYYGSGRFDDAAIAYSKTHEKYRDASLLTNLGVALQRSGRLNSAIRAYRLSLRYQPDDALTYSDLAAALLQTGDSDSALVAARAATRIQPESPAAYYHLGLALLHSGKVAESATAFEKSLALSSKHGDRQAPIVRRIQESREWKSIDRQLDDVKNEIVKPMDGFTASAIAQCLMWKKDYRASLRYFEMAFRMDAKLLANGNSHRALAARTAILAARQLTEGSASNPADAARLRSRALMWLREELDFNSSASEKAHAAARSLRLLQNDVRLSSVRDRPGLNALPLAERTKWQRFWRDVAAAIRKLQPNAPDTIAVPVSPVRATRPVS